jgi:hypothetical protein
MGLLDRIEAESSETVVHAEVCVDGRLLGDYLDVRTRLQGLKQSTTMMHDEQLQELTGEFRRLHGLVTDRTHRYTFRCLDRLEREKLKDRCPPTEKQKKLRFEYDPSKFEPQLAARCLVQVDGEDVDDAVERLEEHFRQLWRTLPEGPNGWGVVSKALADVNYEGTQVPPTVRGIGDQLISALNLTMQPDEASP